MEEAKNKPVPKMLFGEFWFEGELTIFFTDTNLGKSILGVQTANSIIKNEEINRFKLEAEKQKILYLDFELSVKQFESRYSKKYSKQYSFDDNFIRVEIISDAEIPKSQDYEDFLCHSLKSSVIATNTNIIIIANITFLKNGNESAN